ncbi:hypothetical protein Tco_1410438, partial [Tanacetum coccineum]
RIGKYFRVIPALMVVESEVLNDFSRFIGILIAEFAAAGTVNLALKIKRDMIIKPLDLKPTIDAMMRDFLQISLRSFAVLLGRTPKSLTLEIHHGGWFTPTPSRSYIGGQVSSVNVVDIDEFCLYDLKDMMSRGMNIQIITRNQSKNGHENTMSDQEAKEIKAEARKIMPQPSTVNCS